MTAELSPPRQFATPPLGDDEIADIEDRAAKRSARRRSGTVVAAVGLGALVLAWPTAKLSTTTDSLTRTTYSFARLCENAHGPEVAGFRIECDRAARGEDPVSGKVLGNLAGPVSGPPRVVQVPGPPALPPGARLPEALTIIAAPGTSPAALDDAAARALAQVAAGGSPTVVVTPPTGTVPAPSTSLPASPQPSEPAEPSETVDPTTGAPPSSEVPPPSPPVTTPETTETTVPETSSSPEPSTTSSSVPETTSAPATSEETETSTERSPLPEPTSTSEAPVEPGLINRLVSVF